MSYYYSRKWKPSKNQVRNFIQKMDDIETFCAAKNILSDGNKDAYFFDVNGIDYRVANYAGPKNTTTNVYIYASKTRLIEIYTAIENGLRVDRRGYVIRNTSRAARS